MASSKTEICNLALSLISQKAIESIDAPESTNEVICAKWYDQARRKALSSHPWNFAKKRALAPATTTPAFEYTDAFQQTAFAQLNLDETQQEALLKPIKIEKQNVADDREVWGERLGGMLPYFIFILCLQGAMAPAADLGAGEKERGTLETLLISPMDRHKLVLGKFFTIATAGIITALITVSSMAIWGLVLSQGMAVEFVVKIMSMIGLVDFLLIFLMLVPVVAVFAAILLSLSIYARSFKEAQSYMGSLIMVVIFPVIIAMMPGVELKGGWVWVPLTNVALAMKELFKGTMDYFALFGIFTSTAVIATGLIFFCIHWFNKEKVLFR